MKRTDQRQIHAGKWLALNSCDYLTSDPKNGKTIIKKNYEFVTRTTRNTNCNIDGACIIPILKYNDGSKKQCLISNYRPALDKYVLEFPGGLIDCNEDVIQAASRELKEETGFILSRMIADFPILTCFSDPWKSNECCNAYICEVDMNLEENKSPIQSQDFGEEINIVLLDFGPNMIHTGIYQSHRRSCFP